MPVCFLAVEKQTTIHDITLSNIEIRIFRVVWCDFVDRFSAYSPLLLLLAAA